MSTFLLFANMSDFFGEVRLRDGALDHVMLTGLGEEHIGASVKDWQTRGVPVRREIFGTKDRPSDIVFFQERVQPREKTFSDALRLWCEDHQITVVSVPSHAHADCWNMMLRLPLESTERFAMLSVIAQAHADELIAWRQFLNEAVQAVASEEQKAHASIAKLQQKAAQGLAKRFAQRAA